MKKASILPQMHPPEHLSRTILARIRKEALLAARRIALALSAAALASLAGLVALARIIASQAADSSAWQYLSLVGSDTGLALASWKEMLFSLAESVPVETVGLFLLCLFSLLFVLRPLAETVGKYPRIPKTA